MKFVRVLSVVFILGLGFPGIPGVPGLNPQDVAIKAAAKQLAPFVAAKVPVILDWKAVFTATPTLPGKPFTPSNDPATQNKLRSSLEAALAHSTTGIVNLAPGDYQIQMRVYCTDVHRHVGHHAVWLMGPLRGARANLLAAMYARASGKNVNFSTLQALSWAMQAGMRYDELGQAQRQLFDSSSRISAPKLPAVFSIRFRTSGTSYRRRSRICRRSMTRFQRWVTRVKQFSKSNTPATRSSETRTTSTR